MDWIFTDLGDRSVDSVRVQSTRTSAGTVPQTIQGGLDTVLLSSAFGGLRAPSALGIVGTLEGNCASASVSRLDWLVPGPGARSSFSMDLTPIQSGTCNQSSPTSSHTRREGGLFFSKFSVVSAAPDYAIAPDLPEIGPEMPARQKTGDRKTETPVRVSLNSAPAGSYRADVSIDRFDAAISGHTHGEPPTATWGSLSLGGSQASIAETCEIEVVGGSGSCELVYRAGEFSGRAHLTARITGPGFDRFASTQIDIRVPHLLNVNDGLISSRLIRFVRGEHPQGSGDDSRHVNAVGFWMTGVSNLGVIRFAEAYAQITSPGIFDEPGEHPEGLVLSLNDMSLPWGGRFDWKATWGGEHSWHRTGASVDINRSSFDRATGRFVEDAGLQTTAQVHDACRRGGGRPFKERDPNKLHCEFSQ